MELQNEKKKTLREMMVALLVSLGLPQNLCGGTILTGKKNNKKLSFQKENNFVSWTQSFPYEKWKGLTVEYGP